jgi:hypothetical protein
MGSASARFAEERLDGAAFGIRFGLLLLELAPPLGTDFFFGLA